MSWVKVYIHMVFSTKNRTPYLSSPELRQKVFRHIKDNAAEKNIWIDCVNGFDNHVHCLISLGKDQTISNVAQMIKGESSFWINKNQLTTEKFAWQNEYWAVGVSESHIENVRKYIYNQEEHHRKKSFTEEVNDFMEKYGWKYIE